MIDDGVVQLLSKDPDVAALLGRRFYPVTRLPETAPVYPYCAYRTVTGGSESTLEGRESDEKTLQFDVFTDVFGDGKKVLVAIRKVLTSFTGNLPDDDATRVLSISKGNEQDNFQFDQRVYHSFIEFDFQYVES